MYSDYLSIDRFERMELYSSLDRKFHQRQIRSGVQNLTSKIGFGGNIRPVNALFSSRAFCTRLVPLFANNGTVVHACRADYVTYGDAWNAYKEKRSSAPCLPWLHEHRASAPTNQCSHRRVASRRDETAEPNVRKRKSSIPRASMERADPHRPINAISDAP